MFACINRVVVWFAAFLILASSNSLVADTATPRKFPLPARGSIQMSVPSNWDDQLRQPPQALPPTINFRARQGKSFEVLVTPLWQIGADTPPSTKDAIRQTVQKAADDAKGQAVEKTIPVIELSGAAGPGFYFSATDKSAKPGEYKYMIQGMLKVSDLTVTFTILTNDGQERVRQDALTMIKSAVHVQP